MYLQSWGVICIFSEKLDSISLFQNTKTFRNTTKTLLNDCVTSLHMNITYCENAAVLRSLMRFPFFPRSCKLFLPVGVW